MRILAILYNHCLVGIKKKPKKKEDGLDWSWSELASLVKYSKSPIQVSLVRFDEDPTSIMNKTAVEWFEL